MMVLRVRVGSWAVPTFAGHAGSASYLTRKVVTGENEILSQFIAIAGRSADFCPAHLRAKHSRLSCAESYPACSAVEQQATRRIRTWPYSLRPDCPFTLAGRAHQLPQGAASVSRKANCVTKLCKSDSPCYFGEKTEGLCDSMASIS